MTRLLTWRRLLAVGAIGAVAVALAPAGPVRFAVYAAVSLLCVVATSVGQRRHRPVRPVAWLLIAFATTVWVGGDLVFLGGGAVGAPPPHDAVIHGTYAVAYVAMAVGLVLLVRVRQQVQHQVARVDALLVIVNVGLLTFLVVMQPTWDLMAGDPLLDRLVAQAYPVADLLLLAIALRVAAATGRNPAGRLLLAAVGTLLLFDLVAQAAPLVPAVAAHPELVQAGWLVMYALLGAVALHPSVTRLAAATGDGESMRPGRLLTLAAFMLVAPATAAAQHVLGITVDTWPVLLTTPVVVVLVLVRMRVMLAHLTEQTHRLAALAETDYVTGLGNRRRFTDDLTAFLSGTSPRRGVVLLVTLDRFAEVSSSLGHAGSDEVVEGTAGRLRAVVGRAGLVARTAEDTYAVLDPTTTTADGAETLAAAVRAALEEPHALPHLSVALDVRIGLVLVPQDAADAVTALRRAEVAQQAAAERPGRVAHYLPEMGEGSQETAALVREVTAALAAGQIVLHYQPQVCLVTGRVLGVEALARWQHPERGLLGPGAFITAVEQSGLIGPFTDHVLDTALAQCALWAAAGRMMTMAVNLSVRNLLDPALVPKVADALDRHGVAPHQLELEITEGSAMVDRNRSVDVVGALAAMGIVLSIDDYGTGYSSLAYLQRLPVGRLKIDRSFVNGVVADEGSATIVRSTVELARNLGLEVVAEGVEDDRTLLAVQGLRCSVAQGFGLGRPVPADAVDALLAQIENRVPVLLGAQVPAQRGGGAPV